MFKELNVRESSRYGCDLKDVFIDYRLHRAKALWRNECDAYLKDTFLMAIQSTVKIFF